MIFLKKNVARILEGKLVGSIVDFVCNKEIKLNNLKFDVSSPVIRMNTKSQLFFGYYESAEIRFINKYLDNYYDVIEIGANIGVVSCHILKKIAFKKRLITVEANPQIVGILKKNIELNFPDANYEIINSVLDYSGDENEFGFFRIADNNLGSRVTTSNFAKDKSVVQIKKSTLNSIICEFDVKEFTLVSDIEGAEAEVFKMDYGSFENCRQIIIELHDTNYMKIDEMVNFITQKIQFTYIDNHGPVYVFKNNKNL